MHDITQLWGMCIIGKEEEKITGHILPCPGRCKIANQLRDGGRATVTAILSSTWKSDAGGFLWLSIVTIALSLIIRPQFTIECYRRSTGVGHFWAKFGVKGLTNFNAIWERHMGLSCAKKDRVDIFCRVNTMHERKLTSFNIISLYCIIVSFICILMLINTTWLDLTMLTWQTVWWPVCANVKISYNTTNFSTTQHFFPQQLRSQQLTIYTTT